jgi:hypothetical protein
VNARLQALAQERARLVGLAEVQRVRLAEYSAQFEGPARLTGSILGCFASLRRSPLLVTALAALLAKTPWRKLARLPKWAWRGWRILQFFRGWAR